MKKQLFPILTIVLFLGLLLSSNNFQVQAKTLTATGSLKDVRKAKTYSNLPVRKVRSRWVHYKGRFYYINAAKKLHKGWIIYNGERYYLNKKGQMLLGWNKVSGSWYYFKANGRLNTNIKNSQFILVKSSGTKARVFMLQQKANGKWKQLLSANGFVGRSGVKKNKREGDGATPKGTYTISRAFGVNSNPGTKLPYVKVNNSHYWVDDSSSKYYNKFVSTENVKKDWRSAEHLASYKVAYAYSIVVDYNKNSTPQKGSAIFLHCSTGRPTAGCIAISKNNMLKILKNINRDAKICIY